MSRTRMWSRYSEISRLVDEEFDRNRRLHKSRIHCEKGCSECCHQLFQITEIEAAAISRGMRLMEPAKAARLRDRAGKNLRERASLTGAPEQWGKLPPPGTRLACPALEDGACQIYEFRPLICRRFGMPIFNPDRPDRILACELNFKPGEEIEDGQLIQIQTALHQAWKDVQGEYNRRGGHRDEAAISVARAMVEDFNGPS